MVQNAQVTLFYIADSVPTAADTTRADKIPGVVRFRNAKEDRGNVEACDFVTAGNGVAIPTQYNAKPRMSVEKPTALQIVPNNPSADLSDVEHLDLRAMATFEDGSVLDVTPNCVWQSATVGVATVGAATGIVTPVGVGTSVITATYHYAAPGEAGSAYAAQVFSFATPPDVDDTFTVGDIVYTWKAEPVDTGSPTAVQVKIGASPAEAAANAHKAINRATAGRGTIYSSDAPMNAKVGATSHPTDATKINLKSFIPGTAGNAYPTTQTGDEATFGAATMTGGTAATTTVEDTTTVTVAA